jgi:antitoxin component of RelBE/YafQ-DinJ toxin-antitoxin module
MEDYTGLTVSQLIDMLATHTILYTKVSLKQPQDEELTQLKIKLTALQEEIKKRKDNNQD